MKRVLSLLSSFDWQILIASIILVIFGLIMLFSLNLNVIEDSFVFFYKQFTAGFIGVIFLFWFGVNNYRGLKHYGWLAYFIALGLLVAVLIFGQEIRNIKAWFIIGPISIQPIEFVKVLYIIFLAKFFSQSNRPIYSFGQLIFSGVLTFILVGLTMLQPDWGSAFILFLIWFIFIFFIPFRKVHYLIVILFLIFSLGISWQWVLQDYQKSRIVTFLHPAADPLGEGYNITQAKVAVGSGGFNGRGLGLGTQSQLRFLPEAQTDFIFAVIAEELGWLGSMVLLFLFALIFYRLVKTIKIARTDFGMFIVLGVVIYLFAQMAVNIGMNIGLFPIAGIPLPFVSAGGSALLAVFIALGLAQSVYLHDK